LTHTKILRDGHVRKKTEAARLR